MQELVESEREYQLCDQGGRRGGGGGVLFFFFFRSFPFMPQFCLSTFIFPLTSRDGLCDGTTLIPFSLSQGDTPHAEPASGWRCGVLSGVSVHLSTGSRGVSSCVCCQLWVCVCVCVFVCLCKFLAALTHRPSNTEMLLLV